MIVAPQDDFSKVGEASKEIAKCSHLGTTGLLEKQFGKKQMKNVHERGHVPSARFPSLHIKRYQRAGQGDQMRRRTRVDDGNCHENTRSGADCTHEVSSDRKQAKDGTTQRGRCRNDTFQFLIH